MTNKRLSLPNWAHQFT